MSDNSRSAYHKKRQIIEYLPSIHQHEKKKRKKKRKNKKNGRKKRKRGMDGTRAFLLIIYIHII